MNYINKLDLWLSNNTVYDFFKNYRFILLISVIIGILVNAVDIFTVKFGMDSEIYASNSAIYYTQQRYGSDLLYYLFPFARYHIVSQLTGMICIALSAMLTISRHNISNFAKGIFVVLVTASPYFSLLQYFYFQSAYNFIYLLITVIVFRILENNKNIFIYIIGILLLALSLSSYQSLFAVYLSVMMINVILDFINNKKIKAALITILKNSLVLIAAVIIYFIVIKIVSTNINSYHAGFIQYLTKDFLDVIKFVIKYIIQVMFGRNFNSFFTANVLVTILLLIMMIYLPVKIFKERNERIFIVVLFIFFILSVFSMNILFGSELPPRTNLSYAFYSAFPVMLFFMYCKRNSLKLLTYLIVFSIIVFQAGNVAKFQTAQLITYNKDKMTAEDLLNRIYKAYPEIYDAKYKIAFTGKIDNPNRHRLAMGYDIYNCSFFNCDNGNPDRYMKILQLLGMPTNVQRENVNDSMKPFIDKMPMWPDEKCIQLYDNNTVIVKLR